MNLQFIYKWIFIKKKCSICFTGCAGCKALKKDYARAAFWTKKEGLRTQLVTMDATVYKNTVKTQNVTKFPIIKYYENKRFVADYVGKLNAEDIFAFVTKYSKRAKKDEL